MKGLIFFVKNYEISKLYFRFVRKNEDKNTHLIYRNLQRLLTIKEIDNFDFLTLSNVLNIKP